MSWCPNCKSEYRPGFTRRSDRSYLRRRKIMRTLIQLSLGLSLLALLFIVLPNLFFS